MGVSFCYHGHWDPLRRKRCRHDIHMATLMIFRRDPEGRDLRDRTNQLSSLVPLPNPPKRPPGVVAAFEDAALIPFCNLDGKNQVPPPPPPPPNPVFPRGGGGVLGLEKGTNCGPTTAERWLSRREMAKKGGLSTYYIVREWSCQSLCMQYSTLYNNCIHSNFFLKAFDTIIC